MHQPLSWSSPSSCWERPQQRKMWSWNWSCWQMLQGSIDPDEIAFQRNGYGIAITDPRVLQAIAGTAYGRIALTYVEWARRRD